MKKIAVARSFCYHSLKTDFDYFVFIMMLDLDPCIEVTCYHYGHCKAVGPRDARCVCVNSCPSYQEPVCSSNGTTFDNKCLFEQEMCSLGLNFTIQHPGACEGKINLSYICGVALVFILIY